MPAALLWALLGLSLGARQAASQSQPPTARHKVVVSAGNPTEALPRAQLSAIFLKQVTEWPHGGRPLPVDLPEGSPAREGFSLAVHGREAAAIKSHWLQVIFSGRGVPPPERSTEDEVLAYVGTHRGAVGYVSSNRPLPDGVKVLRIQP